MNGQKPNTEQKPSVGRIVHLVDGLGTHLAAIITAVEPQGLVEGAGASVYLHEFGPAGSISGVLGYSVAHDEEIKAPGSWHFPERVD